MQGTCVQNGAWTRALRHHRVAEMCAHYVNDLSSVLPYFPLVSLFSFPSRSFSRAANLRKGGMDRKASSSSSGSAAGGGAR